MEKIAERLEREADELNNSTINFEAAGKKFRLKVVVQWCQGDGSLWAKLSGRGSAYCQKCPATETEGNCIHNIRQKFKEEISIQDIHAQYEKLAGEGRMDTSPPKVGTKRKHKV